MARPPGMGGGRGGGFAPGSTLTGMVKSYNKRGFGFIMCQKTDQDIYFSRDSLHPQLRTSDLAGEHVAFDIYRFPDGKLQAKNLRPLGDVSDFRGERCYTFLKGKGKGQGWTPGPSLSTCRREEEEDRSRDWYCKGCKERNFVKRSECFKCKLPRQHSEAEHQGEPPAPPRRTFSPHAGSRAVREVISAGRSTQAASRARSSSSSSSKSSKKAGRRRSRSRTRSSKPDPAAAADRDKGRRGVKSRSRSSSSSGSSSSNSNDSEDKKKKKKKPVNPEVEKAKAEALEKLLKLKEVEPKDQRMKEWRTLLREWHPDKNPERVEVATAVFQFLQKGKQLLDAM